MSDPTTQKLAELRRACNSLFSSHGFRFGVKDLARVIAGKPSLETNPDLDRRFASTSGFYSQGVHGLARLCAVDKSTGFFVYEHYLDKDTVEFLLPLNKVLFIFSPLSQWQIHRFLKDCCRRGVLQIRHPKKYRGMKPHPEAYFHTRLNRKGWSTEIRIRVNIGRLQELLASLKSTKLDMPEQVWVQPPPRYPGDTEIGTKQVSYFRSLNHSGESPLERQSVYPGRPLPLPMDLDEGQIINQWHDLHLGKPWGDRMNDICAWIAGKANLWFNRDCDRRRNRVPGWLERFLKTFLAFHAVDQKTWRFKELERFYFSYWFSTCPAEVCRLANITLKQYREGMELLMSERVGLLDRERDHTTRRGSRVFLHFKCDRWLWILANIDEWKKEKRGRAEEIVEEAMKSLNAQKSGQNCPPRPSALNLRFKSIVEHFYMPIDYSDASHLLINRPMEFVPATEERKLSSAFGFGKVSFFKKKNNTSDGVSNKVLARDFQSVHCDDRFPKAVQPDTRCEEPFAEQSIDKVSLRQRKIGSLPEGESLTPGKNRLGEAVFHGTLDREGQKMIDWFARMFGPSLLTGDTVRRIQQLRCLPGHQRLTMAKLEAIEDAIRNAMRPGDCIFPNWLYNMFDRPIHWLETYNDGGCADSSRSEALAVFLNAWPGHIAFAVARLDWANYEDELDFLNEFKDCQAEWKSRVEQLKRAPRKYRDWVFRGHIRDLPLRFGGGGLDAIALQLFLFAHERKWPAEVTYLILGARVLKLLHESPVFFLATDSSCGWSWRLGLSKEEIALLTNQAEGQLYRARWTVQQAEEHGACILSHYCHSTPLTPEDLVDDPPEGLFTSTSSASQETMSEADLIGLAVKDGVLSAADVVYLEIKRKAREGTLAGQH